MTSGIGRLPAARFPSLRLTAVFAVLLALAAWPGLARAQDQQAPEAVVKALYQHYIDTGPNDEFTFDFTQPDAAATYFDPALAKLMVADSQREEPLLDFDPFVGGQDFEIKKVDTTTEKLSDTTARVTAKFDNFDEKKTVVFTLTRTPKGWRISDASWGEAGVTLRSVLSAPAR